MKYKLFQMALIIVSSVISPPALAGTIFWQDKSRAVTVYDTGSNCEMPFRFRQGSTLTFGYDPSDGLLYLIMQDKVFRSMANGKRITIQIAVTVDAVDNILPADAIEFSSDVGGNGQGFMAKISPFHSIWLQSGRWLRLLWDEKLVGGMQLDTASGYGFRQLESCSHKYEKRSDPFSSNPAPKAPFSAK